MHFHYPKPAPIPAEIFRAYDIRGEAETQLSPALMYHLGLAIGTQVQHQNHLVDDTNQVLSQGKKNTVAVAADGRLSSPSLTQALIKGIVDSGCNAINIGFVPTPLLYFSVHALGLHSGVMVTGSHNPAHYNGVKMVIGGITLANQAITDLHTIIEQQNYLQGQGKVSHTDIIPAYLHDVCDKVNLANGSTSPLKIVIDAGNGITGVCAPELFRALGCEVFELYCEVDGHFPNHHPDPSKPANLKDLKAAVQAHQADLGLAFDGDGDRVGVITPKLKNIFADKLLMLFAKDVLSRHPGAEIMYDVKCSRLLKPLIEEYGGLATMCQTGHSLVKNQMRKNNALLAGEMSGHIFFKERWYGFDDGLYIGARLCELLAHSPSDADALFDQLPEEISTPEINISVSEDNKFELVKQLQNWPYADGTPYTLDGLRVDFEDGFGLVRASNTTPLLVLRFEGKDQAALTRIQNLFQRHLSQVDDQLIIPL